MSKEDELLKRDYIHTEEPVLSPKNVPWINNIETEKLPKLPEIVVVREELEYDHSKQILECLVQWLDQEVESKNAYTYEQRGKIMTEILSKIAHMKEYKLFGKE
jgi:hypothetical protein